MSYKNLTFEEREWIQFYQNKSLNLSKIAELLGRNKSTISREIRRNNHSWYGYNAIYADYKMKKRVYGRRNKPVLDNLEIYGFVEKHLERGLAPDVISGRAKLENHKIQISHESIYRLVYRNFWHGGNLWKYLPCMRRRRKRQRLKADGRGQIANRTSIDERPGHVEKRNRFGHWEADTIIGKNHKGAILTAVERKSRFLIGSLLDKKDSRSMLANFKRKFMSLPRKLRRTVTVDNGQEFSCHEKITKQTDIDVYFAHPNSPHERGANENANRILRRYIPKGTDFSKLSSNEVNAVIRTINNRPRKILRYLTPYEVLFNNKNVALQI